MGRIAKTEHPRILRLVDDEHARVTDVAAEYGCTPANIYALLGKLRQTTLPRTTRESAIARVADTFSSNEPPASVEVPSPSVVMLPEDLFAEKALPSAELSSVPASRKPSPPDLAPVVSTALKPGGGKLSGSGWGFASVADLPGSKAVPSKTHSVSVSSTKGGFGLVMRTAEGDESTTPFRSIDDLLSAAKLILRSAARSQDTIWFSIRPVELTTFEIDAA